MPPTGNLIIVSGPSGAGKSAIATLVLQRVAGVCFSVSYTTRPPRDNERDGVHYHFVGKAEFEALVRDHHLLEWAEVYGNFYGTAGKFIDDRLGGGEDVLLDVDVQGARSIRALRPEAISVFILPPSYQVLKSRLENRKLDKDYVIEQRLRIARSEMSHYREYDYLIINEDLESSVADLQAIILGSRCRRANRVGAVESIVATFGGLNAQNS